jgi:hypothetical protein
MTGRDAGRAGAHRAGGWEQRAQRCAHVRVASGRGAESYEIQVDDADKGHPADFARPERDETTTGTEFVLTPGLSRGTYHWHVRAVSGSEVGDGVNDAPALAQADLSVTVAGGTDVAGETSDVVLTHLDLILVPGFIALSRRTRRTIMQNLGWAFAYNLVSVPLAALGFISPAIAAVTMVASSLLVVGNSLRLRG